MGMSPIATFEDLCVAFLLVFISCQQGGLNKLVGLHCQSEGASDGRMLEILCDDMKADQSGERLDYRGPREEVAFDR